MNLLDMFHKANINGVDITAFGSEPKADQWGKFLAFARKAAPPELASKIKNVFAVADFNEYGTTFHISYTVLLDAGYFVPESEINAMEGEQ